jgi:CHAT domain-containing protein/tetratricopeptide (TPR) repeat protein
MSLSSLIRAGRIALVVALPVCAGPSAVAQTTPVLEVEKELEGGGKQPHVVELQAGQVLRAAADQRGIDIVLALRSPGGTSLVEMDGVTGPLGPEELRWEATETGAYVVEVRASTAIANPGRYALRIEVLAAANERERAWMAAQRLFMVGRRALRSGDGAALESAIPVLASALPKWREAGDQVWEATTLLNLGVLHFRLNQVDEAAEIYQQALALYRQIGDRRGEGATLSNVADVHHTQFRYAQAYETYEQALAIRREIGDRFGEAATLGNLATVYKDLGEYELARDTYEQALAIAREVKNRRFEGVLLSNLGNVYGELTEFDRARSFWEQGLAISREVKDRRREAIGLNNLGVGAEQRGDAVAARAYYEQALVLWREVKDRSGEALVLANLGDVCSRLGEYARAQELYAQALALQRETKERIGEAGSLADLGVVSRHLGQPERAREYLEQALAVAREVKGRPEEAGSLYQLALLARQRGDLAAARELALAALSAVESLRGDVGAFDLRAAYFTSVQDYFALTIAVLMDLHRAQPGKGYDAAALETAERARARGLLDLLAEARAEVREGAPAPLRERERNLRGEMNAAAAAQQELLGNPHTPEEAAVLEKRLQALSLEYQDVEAQLRRTSPRYAALSQPQPLTLAEMRTQLLDPDTVLLMYSLSAAETEHSYLWAVTSDSLTSFELPKREVVEAAARRYLVTMTEPPSAQARTVPAAASELSDMLLAPVASRLGRKRLVVIGDGALQYVPFAALPVPAGSGSRQRDRPLLIADHEIVYEASASSLASVRSELAGRLPAAHAVAVLADPVFAVDDERVTRVRPAASAASGPRSAPMSDELARALSTVHVRGAGAGAGLPRLPFARREAEAIAAAARPGEAMKALDFEASRETATSGALARYRIVHFATHGLLNASRPDLSGLVLSLVDAEGRPRDGFLRLHDIYNLRLPAELVVLSACQTGLGQEIRGEGLIGLTRGFMYAGAARVVASLWQVDDVATAELMRRFYRGMLREGQRPAAALRAAQVEMSREEAWHSPYYWSGFVLQGEWR